MPENTSQQILDTGNLKSDLLLKLFNFIRIAISIRCTNDLQKKKVPDLKTAEGVIWTKGGPLRQLPACPSVKSIR